ncbi:MAG: sugar ABC transporter substrate-binding protein [Bacilli bacterium]|jgi:ABC-type glycerol-3-phosphate transport system substrate-binding protein|nr:sugar ABC transporter substrate-binding protein [Bacilli bacterium]
MKRSKVLGLVLLVCVVFTATVFAAGQAEQPKKITALYFSSTYADAAKSYVDEFKEKTGITVEIVEYPYISLYERMGLALATGDTSYDLVTVACQWDGEFEPFLEDLSDYIERDNWDEADIMQKLWQQSGIWNNRIIGIPFANTPQLISYRTDLVGTPPKTWDEFFGVCDELYDPNKGFYPIAVPGVKEQLSGLWMSVHWSLDGRWADEDWNVTIDAEETREALRITKRWFDYADPAAPAWGLPEADAAFLNGKAAFCFAWPTLGVAVQGDNPERSKVVDKWAVAGFPAEKTGVTNLSSWDIGIPKASKNKDAAWEWIKFYTSKEKQLTNFTDFSILPSRTSVWENPVIKQSKMYPHKAISDKGAVIWWRIPAGTMAETYVRDAVANYVTGQWDIERAVKYMEKNFKELLAKYPPAEGVKNTGR